MNGSNIAGSSLNNNNNNSSSDEEEDIGALYSLLPNRDATVRERWKYRIRRWIFYNMFVAFLVVMVQSPFMINDLGSWFWVIHMLYFDLDVTVTKNQQFVRFFHGCSFIGSFITGAMGSLVLAFEPSFINSRSAMNHRSIAAMWVIHSFTNYLPPFLHFFDLTYNYEALRKRHYILLPGSIPKHTRYSPTRKALYVAWMLLSPVAVAAVWFVLHLPPEYDVIHDYLSVVVPSLVVLDFLAGILLLVVLVVRPRSQYTPIADGVAPAKP